MNIKDLRYKYDLIFEQKADEDKQKMLCSVVGDLILFLEEQPQPMPEWNERLGPKPEDLAPNPEDVERFVQQVKDALAKEAGQ